MALAAQTRGPQAELVSLLGRELYPLPDTSGVVAKADAALAADPGNLDRLLDAARARDLLLQFRESIAVYTKGLDTAPGDVRLYRMRGHRYISIRSFDDAVRDLEQAAKLASSSFDVSYHLALAYYLRGEFARAADEYGRCLAMSKAGAALPPGWRSCAGLDDDTRVAAADWRYRALRRAGRHDEARRLLDPIHEKMAVKENESYYRALLFYKKLRSEEEVLSPATLQGTQFATVGYGVAVHHLVEGNAARACALLREITSGPNWAAFGFIGAEVDLARQGVCR